MTNRLPTHIEVGDVLKNSHPDIAKLLYECDPKRNCWGDLIIQLQRDFDLHHVATCFRVLFIKGWAKYITMTWCPLTDELWKHFEKAKSLQDDYKELTEWDKRFRKVTIHGALALTQIIYKRERAKWMREWAVSGEDDPNFFNQIILYLESKREMDNEKIGNQSN